MSKAYAYKTLEPYLKESTSGGAFSQIVETFFKKGNGVVYGAVLDDSTNVRHHRVVTQSECQIFRKSKYVKSDITGIYQQVMDDLQDEQRVLFTGLPCQVYALIKYLEIKKIKTDSLTTIDLICNGAPSNKVWQDYKTWLQEYYKKPLSYFGFREKGDKYNPYLTKAVFSDGYTVIDSPRTACYNRLFLKKLIIPQGCFNCPFKREERASDITLGDYWGAERIFKNKNLQKEVSLVLINTSKGEELFTKELIDPKDAIIIESHNKEYLKFQKNLVCPSTAPQNYDKFWNDYGRAGIGYVLNKYGEANFPASIKYKLRKLYRIIKSK